MFVYYKWYILIVSEGTDVNKISSSKECHIFYYWYFLKCSFNFQPNVCNRGRYLLMMSINLNDIAISNLKNSDYCCIISSIIKNEAIKLLQNVNLTEKVENWKNISNLFSYMKMGKEILTFGNSEIEKNKAPIFWWEVDIEKLLVSNKISFDKKEV